MAAGLLTMCGALVCAELASAFPRTGGVYVYLTEAWSPAAGFLWGWAMFWTMHSGILAAIATVFARYAGYFVVLDVTGQRLVAVSAVLVLVGLMLGPSIPLYTIAIQNSVPPQQVGVVVGLHVEQRLLDRGVGERVGRQGIEPLDRRAAHERLGHHVVGGLLEGCDVGLGLLDGPEIVVTGRVGWSASENMMSGVVVIDGNAGSLPGSATSLRRRGPLCRRCSVMALAAQQCYVDEVVRRLGDQRTLPVGFRPAGRPERSGRAAA